VLKIYSCDNAHHVIYDDFLVTQNRRKETTVPYLEGKAEGSETLQLLKLRKVKLFVVRTFTVSYNPMMIGRP
jgi:hypothetical protein